MADKKLFFRVDHSVIMKGVWSQSHWSWIMFGNIVFYIVNYVLIWFFFFWTEALHAVSQNTPLPSVAFHPEHLSLSVLKWSCLNSSLMWGTCVMWTGSVWEARFDAMSLLSRCHFILLSCLHSFSSSHLIKSHPLAYSCLSLLCMHSHSRATCANIHSILYLHNYDIGPRRVPYHIHSNYQQKSQSNRSTSVRM